MMPSRLLLTIASSDDSTIAASRYAAAFGDSDIEVHVDAILTNR